MLSHPSFEFASWAFSLLELSLVQRSDILVSEFAAAAVSH